VPSRRVQVLYKYDKQRVLSRVGVRLHLFGVVPSIIGKRSLMLVMRLGADSVATR
jgi:hypothetical protein